MYKKLLKQFFKENTTESDMPTAPALAHFHLSLDSNPEANEQIRAVMNEAIFSEQPGRQAEVMAERREIEAAETCEQVLRWMRRNTDTMNQHILVQKALLLEEEIVPELIRMLQTSHNTGFIETAIRVLAGSQADVAEALISQFAATRNPYAQAMTLVALGFKAGEARIPWLIDAYQKLKRLYPEESHCEGAYYALVEMDNRFYP